IGSGYPESLRMQPGHHLECASLPIDPCLSQELLDHRVARLDEITEQMHLAPLDSHRELAPADHPHAKLFALSGCDRQPCGGVVVGECNRDESGCCRMTDDLCGRQEPVR